MKTLEKTVSQLLKQRARCRAKRHRTRPSAIKAVRRLIGKAVSHRRQDFYLFTKNAGHPRGIGSEDWSGPSLLESIERSLWRRLKTDRLDLIHCIAARNPFLQKGDAITALQAARRRVTPLHRI